MILEPLKRNFEIAGLPAPVMGTEAEVIEHAPKIYDSIKSWLIGKNYPDALTSLELMMGKKHYEYQKHGEIRTRRDGETPDFLHELRIGLAVIADYLDGTIPEKYLQPLLCIAFTHDLGEDFNILPDAIKKHYENHRTRNRRQFSLASNTNHCDAAYLAVSMERLTFDRKYTAEQIYKQMGLTRNRKDLVVNFDLLQRLCERIENGSECVQGILPPMQFLAEPDSKGRYIFSRFINDGVFDWNLYAQAWRNDRLTGLVKSKDRADGLGTRIGPNFDIHKYGLYLSTTFQIFSLDNVGGKMANQYADLHDSFESTDKMLGALHRIGRSYVELHPLRNPHGSKGFKISTLSENLDFRDYFPNAHRGYCRLPDGINPLHIILSRIYKEPSLNGDGPVLYEKLRRSIENCTLRNSPDTISPVDQLSLDFLC